MQEREGVWSLTLVALALLCVQWGVSTRYFSLDKPVSMNGEVYEDSVQQYIAGGLRLKSIDSSKYPKRALHQDLRSFYRDVPLWIVLCGWTQKLTGWNLTQVFAAVFFVFNYLTSLTIVLLCRRAYALSWLSSGYAGAWFILCPAMPLIYLCQAHPEAVVMFFTALAMLGHQTRRHGWAALAALLGLLSKGTAVPVTVALMLVELSRGFSKSRRRGAWVLAFKGALPYFLALVSHQVLVRFLFDRTDESYFWAGWVLNAIVGMNWARAYCFVLSNFDVLTFFAVFQIVREDQDGRLLHGLFFGFSMLLLTMITDWSRNLFAGAFVSVIPLAAKFIEDSIKRPLGERAAFFVGTLVCFLLLFDWADLGAGMDYTWRYALIVSLCLAAFSIQGRIKKTINIR